MSRAFLLVLLVLAVSALVAIAAPGMGLLHNPIDPGVGWLRGLRMAGAAAVTAGVAGLALQRRHLLSKQDRHYDPAIAALVSAGAIMAVLALLAFLAPAAGTEEEPTPASTAAGPTGAAGTQGTAGSASPASGLGGGFGVGVSAPRGGGALSTRLGDAQSQAGTGDGRDWNALQRAGTIALLILLAATVVICLRILGRRPHYAEQALLSEPPITTADAEAGLVASLGAVTYDGDDPRGQITAAYSSLLAALAKAGAPRKAHEAPHEHLHRALGPLGVTPDPMHRLTALYVIAQFSHEPVTEQHRAAAADALERALAGLRAARVTDGEGTTAVPEQSCA